MLLNTDLHGGAVAGGGSFRRMSCAEPYIADGGLQPFPAGARTSAGCRVQEGLRHAEVLPPFGRRGWKMLYCTLRDLVLYLHKDEHGFRRKHEERVSRLEEELAALRHARDHSHTHHARERDHYLVYEIKRYRTYAYVMRARAGGGGADEDAPALPERNEPAAT
ncbi:unnamed protein product [Leptidea sinapis]|uniref:Pleckstrin homology domain-containing protein n=1 Tax=Leptidea sinapis TaxID=189913 RepID=A0A5E4QZ52_9NEOP|nr:unnamed protein product [Leptidea sinapis]